MDSSISFFLVVLVTIFITKIVLLNPRIHCPTIFGIRLHHWMYGIALIIAGMIVKNMPIYGIGIALFIDQLPLLITNKWQHKDSYSRTTLISIAALLLVIFIFRRELHSLAG